MTTRSIHWQDFFSEEPCEHGWTAFAEAVEKHGLEAAVKGAPLSDRRWGAEYTHRTDILAILAHDAYAGVRECVAKNPHTPAEVLATLATDKDYYVREGVASNPNTPVETLATLAQDTDDDVRSIAQDRLRPTGF